MTRHLENIFIVLFVVISAPLAAGVVTVMVTGAYLMLFGDGKEAMTATLTELKEG